MDPILIAAAHALISQPDSTDPEAFMRQYTAGKYGADDAEQYLGGINTNINPRNVGRSVAMGATANFAPDLMDTSPDAVSGSIPGPVGQLGGAMLKLFGAKPGAGTDMRTKANMYAQAHPAASAAGNMVGMGGAMAAVPEAELGAGANAGVRSALALLKSMGIGYGAGTASVAGAQDPETRDWGAAATSPAAIVSGLAAPVVPAIMGSTNYLTSPAAQAAFRINGAIRNSGGPEGVRAALQPAVDAGYGDQVMLGDASGPLRAAWKYANENSEASQEASRTAISGRQAGQIPRLIAAIKEGVPDLGGDVMPSAGARLEDLKTATNIWRRGPNGYNALEDRVLPNTTLPGTSDTAAPSLSPAGQAFQKFFQGKGTEDLGRTARVLLQDPANMQGPLGQGARDYLDYQKAGGGAEPAAAPATTPGILDSPTIAPIIARAQAAGELRGVDLNAPTMQKLIAVKSGVGDAADRLINAGGGKSDLGFALKDVETEIDQHMQNNDPDYLRVSQDYAGQMAQRRYLQKGIDAMNSNDTDALTRLVKGANPKNLLELRTGMASTLLDNLNGKLRNSDAANSLLDASQEGTIGKASGATQAKLQAIFGDDATYKAFMQKAAVEHLMAMANSTVTGSATYRNQLTSQMEPANVITRSAGSGFNSTSSAMPKALMFRALARAARLQLNEASGSDVGAAMRTRGIGNITQFLNRPRTPLVGPLATQAIPAAIGAGAAGLLGRPDQP